MPSRVRMIIRDPTRAHPDAVRLYAEEHLRGSGVAHPDVIVELLVIVCAECGSAGRPSPMDPVCARCGSPYPPVSGPAIVIEEA